MFYKPNDNPIDIKSDEWKNVATLKAIYDDWVNEPLDLGPNNILLESWALNSQ